VKIWYITLLLGIWQSSERRLYCLFHKPAFLSSAFYLREYTVYFLPVSSYDPFLVEEGKAGFYNYITPFGQKEKQCEQSKIPLVIGEEMLLEAVA
jgi:hypothetical protein